MPHYIKPKEKELSIEDEELDKVIGDIKEKIEKYFAESSDEQIEQDLIDSGYHDFIEFNMPITEEDSHTIYMVDADQENSFKL